VTGATPFQELEITPKTDDNTDIVVSELWGVSFISRKNTAYKIYYFGLEPCVIPAMQDRMIEIIQITLALVLKLLEEIEEPEREGR